MTKNAKIVGRGTDSNVYIENGIIRKYYMHTLALNEDLIVNLKARTDNAKDKIPHLSEKDIKEYHSLQGDLSDFEFGFSVNDIQGIQKVKIKILDVRNVSIANASLIINKGKVIVTEPQNIQTTYDVEKQASYIYNSNYDSIHNITNKYFKKIGLKQLTGIHPEKNYKLTGYNNGEVELTITDIGNDIYSLLRSGSETIRKWITYNIGKKAEDYSEAPKIKRKRINTI